MDWRVSTDRGAEGVNMDWGTKGVSMDWDTGVACRLREYPAAKGKNTKVNTLSNTRMQLFAMQ